MRKFIFIFFTILLILVGCAKDYDLEKSISIPDPVNPQLPAYSEWGYNTFGAYYERDVFTYSDQIVPAKFIVESGVASFQLSGFANGIGRMTMKFTMPEFHPAAFSDLTVLNDISLDLTVPNHRVEILVDSGKYDVKILKGGLSFKRAQNLLVDKSQTETILSGYFEFQALINNEPVSVSSGRFDVGIGPDRFYILN